MELKAVKSSNLKAVGHDAQENRMVVVFHDQETKDGSTKPGAICLYPDTTAAAHAALVGAPSVGHHFYEHFVKPKKPFEKLR